MSTQTPIAVTEVTNVQIDKKVPESGSVSYAIAVDGAPLLEVAAPEHANVIRGAIARGGNSYGRERVARNVLSHAAGTDFWSGNAVWLSVADLEALSAARGLPDELRKKFADKLRERNEEHSATFGGEPPADSESTDLAETRSVEDLKRSLMGDDDGQDD